MQNYAEQANALREMEQDCWIVDYLPQTVSKEDDGQFFAVEYELLNGEHSAALRERFVGVILRMMCYFHMAVLWNGWIDRPDPALIGQAVLVIMENHSGTLECLFPNENTLLLFDWDCLNLTVYHPSVRFRELMEQIAPAEGLFWRESAR